MCGLAGFTFSDVSSRDYETIIADMLRRIEYRGPDENGVVVNDALALGHNRLTIIEPDGGRQPRCHESNGNILIYNGEIYNHRAFDAKIQAAGGVLRDHCDTETLFWLLQQFGIDEALSMVDGMFAFAWYEAGSETLYLARDRFGQKPLFYSIVDGELVFASELRSLRGHPGLTSVAPDLDALMLFLMMEFLPGQATGLEGIFELPAGHLLAWRAGKAEVGRWWQPETGRRDTQIDGAQGTAELDSRLSTAVAEELVADVPVGVFLSGGLDSSLVAAMAKRHKDDVSTFTVKFPFASFDESRHAEAVAAHIGTNHTTIELQQQNCLDGIDRLFANLDQPFADSSFLPSILLCQATKEFVTVALGGDGADELFLGYPNFKVLKAAPMMALMPGAAGRALRSIAGLMPGSDDYMNRAFLLRQLSYGFGKAPQQQSPYWMAAVPPPAQQALWPGQQDVETRIDAMLHNQVSAMEGLPLLESCQQHFIRAYLAHDILTKMDRASMYASLEVRSPFLSNAVSDYAMSLPVNLLLRGGKGKYILGEVAQQYLPAPTIARKKHGFALPVSALLRTDLRDLAKTILLDRANPMYEHIEYDVVQSWWTRHVDAGRDHGKSLWALLMLAAFYRNHF